MAPPACPFHACAATKVSLSPWRYGVPEHTPRPAADALRPFPQQYVVGADGGALHHERVAAELCCALSGRYFNNSTTAVCPEALAMSTAVCRRLFLSPRSAPAASSALTISPWPAALASISAV